MEQETNMYTDGRYLRNNPTWDIEDSAWKAGKIAALLRKNKLGAGLVTEVGCGAGGILHELSRELPAVKQFRGYDISPDAIRLARKFSTDKIQFIQADYTRLSPPEKTELLLLIDVLEHVEDYYGFLQKLRPLSRYFIFHIPLDLSCRTLLKPHVLLQQREAVGHLHYFSREMVLWMLKDTGYTVMDWHYTKPVGDSAPPKSFKQGIKKILRNISFGMHPGLSDKLWGGYSMLILARHDQAE